MKKIISLLISIQFWTILGSIATVVGVILTIYVMNNSSKKFEKIKENKYITKDSLITPEVKKEIIKIKDTINFDEAKSLYNGKVFFTAKKTSNNNVKMTFRGGKAFKDPYLIEKIKYQNQKQQPDFQGLDLDPGGDSIIKASGVTNIITIGTGDRFYFFGLDYSSGKGKLYIMSILSIKEKEMIFEIVNDF